MKKMRPYLTKDLRERGVGKIRFYRTSTHLITNVSTICLFISEEGTVALARGVSIRSMLDPIDKRLGRVMAYGRAKKAFLERKTTGEIHPNLRIGPPIIRRQKISSPETERDFRAEMKLYNWKYKEILNNGKLKTFQYYIPRNFTVSLCFDTFKFKSDYLPTFTPLEFDFVNNAKVT